MAEFDYHPLQGAIDHGQHYGVPNYTIIEREKRADESDEPSERVRVVMPHVSGTAQPTEATEIRDPQKK